ncbi:hypothetical protein DVH24_011251 [Malus domestica]|uniref:Uncharacterized protein n=2 Tax=Malus domestica TaxID=3750 RepID=A0A498JV30_MALDO|nr:hypothetical protein DVH24_011251 [Malus domestica]
MQSPLSNFPKPSQSPLPPHFAPSRRVTLEPKAPNFNPQQQFKPSYPPKSRPTQRLNQLKNSPSNSNFGDIYAELKVKWHLYQELGCIKVVSAQSHTSGNPCFNHFKVRVGSNLLPQRAPLLPCIKCEKDDESSKEVSIERPPYDSYMDSTSGQLEPASGARASIPGQDYWPEGTASRVRAARAPEPTGKSVGSPSYGKNPGSRRKNKTSVAAGESIESSVESSDTVAVEMLEPETSEDTLEDPKDSPSEYVVYQTEPEKEEETGCDLDKKLGRPHPSIDPETKKPLGEPLTSDELWWNWRKPEKENWSRWQRRRPDSETVFLKAMAETGLVKLYGEKPTLTETSLYRARRHLFKEERLQAEQERLDRTGQLAYYLEWVKAWKRDTSREAVQKHFEETGENETTQLIEMFSHHTEREYRIMMGTDIRIRRDPSAMCMREDQIKQIWGGDPVYPTVNYIQDPDEVIDYRGADFHEPTPDMLSFLKEDEGEDSETEVDEQGEKITRNWSVLKTTPELIKSKGNPKKNDGMSLEEAVDDAENLTDFLMDFEEDV